MLSADYSSHLNSFNIDFMFTFLLFSEGSCRAKENDNEMILLLLLYIIWIMCYYK